MVSKLIKTEFSSSTETIEGSVFFLESINDIEISDGISFGILSVSDWFTDDAFKESSEDESSLIINQRADSLHTSTTGKSADDRLGDSHDGVVKIIVQDDNQRCQYYY